MAFDRTQAEATIVEILDGLEGDHVAGLGFRLLDGVIATACHCLPHVGGRVALPDPDEPAPAPVLVRVRQPGAAAVAIAAVVAAEPCSDYALLVGAPPSGPGLPVPPALVAPFQELVASRALARLDLAPATDGPVFVFTHDGRWIEGAVTSSAISIWKQGDRIRTRTSGAPVFGQDGRVVGLVGANDIRLPEATMCALAEHLPGWALRLAHQAEANRGVAVTSLAP